MTYKCIIEQCLGKETFWTLLIINGKKGTQTIQILQKTWCCDARMHGSICTIEMCFYIVIKLNVRNQCFPPILFKHALYSLVKVPQEYSKKALEKVKPPNVISIGTNIL